MKRALLLLALAGCSKILGIDDVSLTDGGMATPDTPVAPPNTVIGRAYTRCLAPAGVTEIPMDLTPLTIAALVPDPSQPTKYRTSIGTSKVDGTFEIDDVPDGTEYLLKIGSAYYLTTLHVIDQHFDRPGRCNPPPVLATAPSRVTFNISGMSPASYDENNSDDIQIESGSLFYEGHTLSGAGDSALNVDYDWMAEGFSWTGGSELPEAGDDVWVLHARRRFQRSSNQRQHGVTTILDSFSTSSFDLPNGGMKTLTGTFTPTPTNQTLSLSVMRGAFDTGFDSGTSLNNLTAQVYASPVLNDFGVGVPLLTVDFLDWSRSTTLTEILSVPYGDPLPSEWVRELSFQYARARYFALPGTTVPKLNASFYDKLIPLTANPVTTPSALPPANVKVAGKDASAGGLVNFDGTAPVTLTWSAVTNAKLYEAIVQRVYANGNQTRTQTTAAFYTTKTAIDVPADVFTGGEFFSFELIALQTPANYAGGEIVPNGAPNQEGLYGSNMFRFSALCGNGTVDSGEDCDVGGETVTCNINCTVARCGDGLRNAASNERCDTVRDSLACDSDCSPNVCGDGHVNGQTEDCDDGNVADDGNGCSATCRRNDVCGDNKTSLFEECDTGAANTATCNADCTIARCGDYIVNTAFTPSGAPGPEQCDEGALNGLAGHCKANCQN